MKNFLIILGAPLWLPLLLATFAIILSVTVVLWVAVIASSWSIFASCVTAGPLGIITGIMTVPESELTGLVLISASMVATGLAIYFFYVSLYLTRLGVSITKPAYRFTIGCFKKGR